MWSALTILLVAYLPGALVFRLAVAERTRRASLAVEERVFWGVILSVVLSSVVVLGLAAPGLYRFNRLLWINAAVCLGVLAVGRGRLRFGAAAPLPTRTALLPITLAIGAAWLNFAVPPAEYVMGGKDPGVYMNEGIQIAQRGTLVKSDDVVASIPADFRDLFFLRRDNPTYYSNRFMGFFLLDPAQGSVISQFPHLYPAWIAISYGVNGLSGARWILGLSGVLGVLAVYFAGTRLVGRSAALAGAGLLAVNVVQVWYARYPNAEMVMQPLVFAGILALVRAQADEDRFFAPVAGVLFALSLFAHMTGALVIAAVVATAVLNRFGGQRLQWSFAVPLAIGTALATAYLVTFLPPYFAVPVRFFSSFTLAQKVLVGMLPLLAVFLWKAASYERVSAGVRRWFPVGLVLAVWLGAAYAAVVRAPGGRLAPHDADALRTFAAFYISPLGLAAALIGFLVLVRRSFWISAPFLIIVSAFSFFFFYKIRIIPEHFWAARRFLAVILPGALLLVGAAAFSGGRASEPEHADEPRRRGVHAIRYVLGLLFVLMLGQHFLRSAQPILRHVEYAGLIPRLERLAATFEGNDLVLVESRGASDVHVLALPLAYIYARNVLVLATTDPDKALFREFLAWTRDRYGRVFFVGGGGTELLSRTMAVRAVGGERFQVPEYQSPRNAYPRGLTQKEFDFGVYEILRDAVEPENFDLDVGTADDLYVRRFHAKEQHPNGFTFRWTRDVSFVSIVGSRQGCRRLTLWMSNGGRPAAAEVAEVTVHLNDRAIGSATVGVGLDPYRFLLPPDLADQIAGAEDAAQLRIESSTWSPRQFIGNNDDRMLGVNVDRVAIDCGDDPHRP